MYYSREFEMCHFWEIEINFWDIKMCHFREIKILFKIKVKIQSSGD